MKLFKIFCRWRKPCHASLIYFLASLFLKLKDFNLFADDVNHATHRTHTFRRHSRRSRFGWRVSDHSSQRLDQIRLHGWKYQGKVNLWRIFNLLKKQNRLNRWYCCTIFTAIKNVLYAFFALVKIKWNSFN